MRQKLYRQRLNQDEGRRQLYLEKKRLKYQRDKAEGKRPSIANQTPRQQRIQRREWKMKKRDYRSRRKILENAIAMSPPATPQTGMGLVNNTCQQSTRTR